MIFGLLFIMAFIVGLVVYLLTNKWLVAVGFSTALFVANAVSDGVAQDSLGITLVFGLPIIFVASLLGAYVVELRRGDDSEEKEQGIHQEQGQHKD